MAKQAFTRDDLENLREALTEADANGLIGLTDKQVQKLLKKIDVAILLTPA